MEDRAANLEKYFNYLLRNVFRHLVCSEEVLYLRVFVEDTYESCVGPNDANLDSFSMMKWIEKIHEELNRQLDNLPREIVRTCEKEGFRQETKAIKEAENAAKKVKVQNSTSFIYDKYKLHNILDIFFDIDYIIQNILCNHFI